MNKYSIHKTPSQIQSELAGRFKVIRKSRKLSQTELAEKSGVSYGSIRRFEYTGQISLESLLKLAHFFDQLDNFENIFVINEDLKKIEKLFNQ